MISSMKYPDPSENKSSSERRENRTGEDIDMLHEKESDPESSDSGSESYKDNYDAA
jgi:hypothetical protein